MGRPRKPTHIALVEGYREDRINRDEPMPDLSGLTPPVKLSEGAMGFWNKLAPDMKAKGILTDWDLPIFAQLCDALDKYFVFAALLEEHKDDSGVGPYMAQGSAGGVIKHPYWQQMRDALEMVAKLGSRFGMTPADRAKLSVRDGEGVPTGLDELIS
jgi:P27 family predicted phage terminase small subunit